MNASKLFAVAALAAVTSVGAFAGEADYNEHNVRNFASVRSVQDVRAEAVAAAKNRNNEPAGSRVAPVVNSGVERATVRAQAAEAVRLGQIAHGELGLI